MGPKPPWSKTLGNLTDITLELVDGGLTEVNVKPDAPGLEVALEMEEMELVCRRTGCELLLFWTGVPCPLSVLAMVMPCCWGLTFVWCWMGR